MFELHTGDCIDVLKALPDSSVDGVVTSPPYAMQRASTYGGIPEKDYPEWTVAWMQEVWRVLKDDGSVIINIRPHLRGGEISDYVLRTRLALREDGWRELEENHLAQKGWRTLGFPSIAPAVRGSHCYGSENTGGPIVDPKAAGQVSERLAIRGGRIGPHIHDDNWD